MKHFLKIKKLAKQFVIWNLCIISISISILTSLSNVKAASDLGSAAALGSPILNSNHFDTTDWNRWEFICWGVYLSNFCVPLIDNYNTAFKTGVGGSDGRGYKALCFGSGSDAANNEVIETLCDEAISRQILATQPIYVKHVSLKDMMVNSADENYIDTLLTVQETETLRQATFDDLFFRTYMDGKDSIDTDKTVGSTIWSSDYDGKSISDIIVNALGGTIYATAYKFVNYAMVATPYDASLPVFYVMGEDGQYYKILDYTDCWDIQCINLMINGIPNDINKDYKTLFMNKFNSLFGQNQPITLDSFGNITLGNENGTMVFPAALNKNLTKTPSINLLSSWIFNSYIDTINGADLSIAVRQFPWNQGMREIGGNPFSIGSRASGLPALPSSSLGNFAVLYYDSDSAAMYHFVKSLNNKGSAEDHDKFNGTLHYQLNEMVNDGECETDYGSIIRDTFNSDIKSKNQGLPLKIEISSMANTNFMFTKGNNYLTNTILTNNSLVNILWAINRNNRTQYRKYLTSIILPNGKETKDIFSSDPVAIPVMLATSESSREPTDQGAIRFFYRVWYEDYKNESFIPDVDAHDVAYLSTDFAHFYARVNEAWKYYVNFQPEYKNTLAADDATAASVGRGLIKYFRQLGLGVGGSDSVDSTTVGKSTSRVILAYPVSETMKRVSEVLGIVDGTEFSVYSTYIYMTYLDFYGIGKTLTLNNEDTSEFNPNIFNASNSATNITREYLKEKLPESTNAEEQEQTLRELSTLMLSPEKGREYRKKMIYSGLEDFIYEQYNRVVYGGKDSMYNGVASKSSSGFLSVGTLADNPFTAWFINLYTDIAITIIMAVMVFIVVFGIIKRRKIAWYIINISITICVILITPATGDLVPYITSRLTQKIFDSKMTFWAISEGVSNSTMSNDLLINSTELDDDAKLVVQYLVSNLQSVYTDRALMVKQDISQKVMPKLSGIYADIQKIRSARWVLPMVMQQFTGEDKTTEYLYIRLNNMYDDMSNLYWYYNPEDTQYMTIQTVLSAQNAKDGGTLPVFGDHEIGSTLSSSTLALSIIFEDGKWERINDQAIKFRNKAYDEVGSIDAQMVHTKAHMLESDKFWVPSRKWVFGEHAETYGLKADGGKYNNVVDSWQRYINYCLENISNRSDWKTDYTPYTNTLEDFDYTNLERLEYYASGYDRTDRKTVGPNLSYLKYTESPAYYFYNVTKDTWNGYDNSTMSSASIGSVISDLQGTVVVDQDGVYYRNNTPMHLQLNSLINIEELGGKTRDFLDLEFMFQNVIPYLYQVQLLTNGFDRNSGILANETIKNIELYKGEPQAWLYRCNWATKIMENPQFNKPCTVHDKDGNKYEVINPLFPECYPDNRPMIFSEAQMIAEGLDELDLNILELTCVEINRQVADKWTLLLNYASTKGLTKEVLFRQMALDATTIFNQQMSSYGTLDSKYQLYPTSIDLRYLSFDSIMKMLMINATRNTNYAYGDVMQTVISDNSIIDSVLLLIDAWVCAFFIPLARSLLLAAIFFLGLISILSNIFSSGKVKAKTSCGQLISNLLFIAYTSIYYLLFYVLMRVTSNDEVLSTSSMKKTDMDPVWILIIVLLISGVYLWAMIKQIVFCFKNYKDLGFEFYHMTTSAITTNVNNWLADKSERLMNFASGFAGDSRSTRSGGGTSVSGSGSSASKASDVKIVGSDDKATVAVKDDSKKSKSNRSDLQRQASYGAADTSSDSGNITVGDINSKIKAGKEAGKTDIK